MAFIDFRSSAISFLRIFGNFRARCNPYHFCIISFKKEEREGIFPFFFLYDRILPALAGKADYLPVFRQFL